MNGTQSLEQQLLELLRFGGLQSENLAALVKIVAGFSNTGLLKNLKVFPRGIPPIYEGLEVRSIVSTADMSKVVEMFVSEPAVGHIYLFPYGLPKVDLAEVAVTLGPTPSQSGGAAPTAAG